MQASEGFLPRKLTFRSNRLVFSWEIVALSALASFLVNFALSLGQPWDAIHVAIDPHQNIDIQQIWAAGIGIGELTMLPSPYRSLSDPIRRYISLLQAEDPNAFIHILVGQLALPNYWEQALHRNTNILIDLILRDMDRVVVTSVPYQIDLRERFIARLKQEVTKDDQTNS